MSKPVQEPLSELLVELPRRHHPGLDRDERQNLASEAVLRGQSQPPPDGQLRPWVHRIYQHLLIDRLRRLSVERKMAAREAPAICRETPEELLALAQCRAQVREAIAALPPRWQQPVYLRFIEGQACDDIAATLGVSRVTVRTRLHRAAVELRRRLAAVRMVIVGPFTSLSSSVTGMALVLALGPTLPELTASAVQPSQQLPVRHETHTPSLHAVATGEVPPPATPTPVRPRSAPRAEATNLSPAPVTSYEFDADEVDGTGLQPDVEIITSDTAAAQHSLLEIPDSLLVPLLKSLEEL